MWLRILDWIGLTNLTDKDIARFEAVYGNKLPNALVWVPVWGGIFPLALAASAIVTEDRWKYFFFAVGVYAVIAGLLVIPAIHKQFLSPIITRLIRILCGATGVVLLPLFLCVFLAVSLIPSGDYPSWIPLEVKEIGYGSWTTLKGTLGVSSTSGWLDLIQPISLQKGDRLQLSLGGTAKKILVQLLPQGQKSSKPANIIGSFDVVESDAGLRMVKLTLDADHPDVVRICVHGGPNPFGLFPFADALNGRATLLNAKLLSAGIPEKDFGSPQRIDSPRDSGIPENNLELAIYYPKGQRFRQLAQRLQKIIPHTVRGWNINVYTVEKDVSGGAAEGVGHSLEFHYRPGMNHVATEIWKRILPDYNISRYEDASLATHFEIKIGTE